MFNPIEQEISEAIVINNTIGSLFGVHLTPNKDDLYTIFIRGGINRDGYVLDEKEYDACRISLSKPSYINLGYNIELTQDEKNFINKSIHENWNYINEIKDLNNIIFNLNECPDYSKL